MYPVEHRAVRGGASGFTLLEVIVVVVIVGIMLAVGIPAMSRWAASAKSAGAVEFYAEGFRLARQQALAHNSASRIVLTANDSNGQYDWQVDLCFPTVVAPCSGSSGGWSTEAAIATGDPENANGYRSVRRSASALPKHAILAITMIPNGNSSIYFNSVGWVDTAFDERLSALRFGPGSGYEDAIRPAALVVGLAGTTTQCDWTVAATDSRACPP